MKPPSIPGKPPPDFQSISGIGSTWRGQALLRGELYFDGSFFPLIRPEQFNLRAEGSPSARLLGRAYMVAWGWRPPQDFLDDDPVLIGCRLLCWVIHYEYFMGTAPKAASSSVLSRLGQEGRLLSSLLPGEDCGSRNLIACAGLLAAYLVFPSQDGFLSRYERFSAEALESALLPGGTVVERNPSAQLDFVYLLYRLWEIHLLIGVEFPLQFKTALSRSVTSLAAQVHGDGALAIFNGASEGNADFIQALLRSLNIPVTFAASSFHDAFVRMECGKGLVLIDAGRPVEDLPQNKTHAGILSFEFSYGKTRIFSNMGAGILPERQKAWRQGSSHNLIVPNGKSCLLFKDEEDFIYAPRYIQRHTYTQDDGELIVLSHDFYRVSLGGTWERQIFLSHNGELLRGEELWYGRQMPDMVMRFHLHPDVDAVWEEDEIIIRSAGMAWRFSCEGGVLCLDDDLYVGKVVPKETKQIVIHATKHRQLEQYSFGTEDWIAGTKKSQRIFRWYLERVPA
ncbi:heparinase ii iii family protein [Lasius niger]|uniref:Heparinase ii iii family protein n=1 Tax=Lasius niger TaxID=67767 RepID=A0A0J7L094_LASNI|nr:heparinase ii iii family protein [Lasius niger]